MLSQLKKFFKDRQEEIILFITIVLISLLSFAMGFIVAKLQEKTPIRFEEQGTGKIRQMVRYRCSSIDFYLIV